MAAEVLRSTVNTQAMERRVRRAARYVLGKRQLQADYEHGQWWVTHRPTGAQWSVVDCATAAGVDYFGFEQVSRGDEE